MHLCLQMQCLSKKGRGIFAILRPFLVGRYFDFYTALSQVPLVSGFFFWTEYPSASNPREFFVYASLSATLTASIASFA